MPSPYTVVTSSTSNPAPIAASLSATPPPLKPLAGGAPLSASPKSAFARLNPHSIAVARDPYLHSWTSSRSPAATQHIASAAIDNNHLQPSYESSFSPADLPRTSSLLPPPRLTPAIPPGETRPTFQNPFNARPVEPDNNRGSPARNRTSRSSSAGGLSESPRNLNRWSLSSTSSRTDYRTFGRRGSVDVGAGLRDSPRKQSRDRPPITNESPRTNLATRARQESPTPIAPTLPLITTLPSLEVELQSQTSSAVGPAPRRPTILSQPSEDAATYWDDPDNSTVGKPLLSGPVANAGALLPGDGLQSQSTMPHNQYGESKGHSRTRSASGAKSSVDSTSSTKSRDRTSKQPSQKAMLSKALQKANMAVQLDNAQNTEGARLAYSEACELLQQVLSRTGGDEDRRKLEAIRKTYTSRIDELDVILGPKPKTQQRRPDAANKRESRTGRPSNDESGFMINGGSTQGPQDIYGPRESQAISFSVPTQARRQLNPRTPETPRETFSASSTYLPDQYSLQSSFSKPRSPRSPRGFDNDNVRLQQPLDNPYIPPPLSPMRNFSPAKTPQLDAEQAGLRSDYAAPTRLAPVAASSTGHQRGNSKESVSWLDPIDESENNSCASSVHSRSPSMGIRRKHIRAASGDTEAEFDAALDDAIEAAYDDGYDPEPVAMGMAARQEDPGDTVARALRRVELARERVRESEREAMELANERERRLRLQQRLEDEELRAQQGLPPEPDDFFDGVDSDEEEERLLDEMTRNYAIDGDFTFGQTSKPAPRASDSSGLTTRTWHTSMGSDPPTGMSALSTVSEITFTSGIAKPSSNRPPPPPPTQALPQLPPQPAVSAQQASPPQPLSAGSRNSLNANIQGVRDRRLSGQNPKQLKIETSQITPAAGPQSAQPKTGGYIVQQRQALSAGPKTAGPVPTKRAPSPGPGTVAVGSAGAALSTPPLPLGNFQDGEARSGSPARPALRKNFSSSSLRSQKSRNLLISSTIDDASDMSPGTPLSNPFGVGGSATRLPAMPGIPTPVAATFKDRANTTTTGGLYLFESSFHSPRSPGSPSTDPQVVDAPAPLEPCPSDAMLRPFWLMRCMYQTLCHPRGGYLSTKLFVPRDVWRVKGVKLRNVEDKISNCDFLTAALLNFARVDSCDADAVLEEMQALEGVLDQAQAALTRKLGGDVGMQGATGLFRDGGGDDSAPAAGMSGSSGAAGLGPAVPRSASVNNKAAGSGFSWRRLRSKNSSAALYTKGSAAAMAAVVVDGASGGPAGTSLASLPMTSHPTSKPTKRDVGAVQFGGPNAQYMSALAKLFDAAQAIDQIARQVDDPGLRHADKTQVGLELCTRHAAEFFGFYVCRFALADLALLLDKFVKRGSEWVLA